MENEHLARALNLTPFRCNIKTTFTNDQIYKLTLCSLEKKKAAVNPLTSQIQPVLVTSTSYLRLMPLDDK